MCVAVVDITLPVIEVDVYPGGSGNAVDFIFVGGVFRSMTHCGGTGVAIASLDR